MYLILVVVSLMFEIYVCVKYCINVGCYNNKYMFFGFVDEFVYWSINLLMCSKNFIMIY